MIEIYPQVRILEINYRLPPLQGVSTNQINYGRIVRYQILSKIFPNLMEHALNYSDPKPLFHVLDLLRQETDAPYWIELKAHKRNPLLLLDLLVGASQLEQEAYL